jgi:YD repeat-containing protein
MSRRSWVALLVSVTLLVLGLPAPGAVAITQPNQITYVYDELGRLEAAIDPAATNGIARYSYDARGNLVSIARQSSAATSIIDFHPKLAKRDARVTVYGAGSVRPPPATPSDSAGRRVRRPPLSRPPRPSWSWTSPTRGRWTTRSTCRRPGLPVCRRGRRARPA